MLAAPRYVTTAECSSSELDPSAKRKRRLLVNQRRCNSWSHYQDFNLSLFTRKVTIHTVAICILRDTHSELGVV